MNYQKPAFHEDSVQSLFEELSNRVLDEGIETYGEYRELVQELLQEKLNEGIFDVNEDLPTIESDLEGRWPEIEATLR
ncbi:MAG: hypothetical protein WCJ25_04995 [Candidatus Moraniibacteriota bacterium]